MQNKNNETVKTATKFTFDLFNNEIKRARQEAIDAKRRFENIDLTDPSDPRTQTAIEAELRRLEKEANRWQGVVNKPNKEPNFFRRLFGMGDPRSRDQIVGMDRDEKRLDASRLRDELELAKEDAIVMADVAGDILIDPDLDLNDLKNYSQKSGEKQIDKITRLLDIMIERFNNIEKQLPGKSVGENMKSVNQEEKDAVNSAVRYYRSMTATMNDVVGVSSSKSSATKWPFGGGNDDVDNAPDIIELSGMNNSDLAALDLGGVAPEEAVEVIEEAPLYELEDIQDEVLGLQGQVADVSSAYSPDIQAPSQQQQILNEFERVLATAQGVLHENEQLRVSHPDNRLVQEAVENTYNSVAPIVQQFEQFVDPNTEMFYDAYSARSYSKTIVTAMKNLDYPVTVKGIKVDPKKIKEGLRKLAAGAGAAAINLKNKVTKLKVAKGKVAVAKKKKATQKR